MSTTYDPPEADSPQQAQWPQQGQSPQWVPPPQWDPRSPWPGAGGPGGPGGPAGDGGGPREAGGPGRRGHRRGLAFAAAGVAFAVAAGISAWAAAGAYTTVLSTSAIASRTDPGLVDITSTLGYQQAASAGTGMVLTPAGEVLTNNHVIAGATAIKVRDIGNGRTYAASVVGYTKTHDVAVLQLKGASGLTTVATGDSAKVSAGQKVVALGNAEGKGGTPAVATGEVTALGSSITAVDDGSGTAEHLSGLIRTNAGIQPGDSGGPLVSTAGQVVGMDTAASQNSSQGGSADAASTTAATTTAFSIPINEALSIAGQIEAGHSSSSVHIGATGFMGISVASSASQQAGSGGQSGAGARVETAVPGSPAARAGLSAGDTIVSLGGHQVTSASGLQSVIEGYHPGGSVSVSWTDQLGQTHTGTLVLTTGPAG